MVYGAWSNNPVPLTEDDPVEQLRMPMPAPVGGAHHRPGPAPPSIHHPGDRRRIRNVEAFHRIADRKPCKRIAAVGPASSVLLAAIFFGIYQGVGELGIDRRGLPVARYHRQLR